MRKWNTLRITLHCAEVEVQTTHHRDEADPSDPINPTWKPNQPDPTQPDQHIGWPTQPSKLIRRSQPTRPNWTTQPAQTDQQIKLTDLTELSHRLGWPVNLPAPNGQSTIKKMTALQIVSQFVTPNTLIAVCGTDANGVANLGYVTFVDPIPFVPTCYVTKFSVSVFFRGGSFCSVSVRTLCWVP